MLVICFKLCCYISSFYLISRLNIRKILTGSENSPYYPSSKSDCLAIISNSEYKSLNSHPGLCPRQNRTASMGITRVKSFSQVSQNLVMHSQNLIS